MFTSAWSPGVPGLPTTTATFTKPSEAAAWPFASGVPTVSAADCWTGGWQERYASGGPWFRWKDALLVRGHERGPDRRGAAGPQCPLTVNGCQSGSSFWVPVVGSNTGFDPSALIVLRSRSPLGREASFVPSGDQCGRRLSPEEMTWSPVPSGFMTVNLVAELAAAAVGPPNTRSSSRSAPSPAPGSGWPVAIASGCSRPRPSPRHAGCSERSCSSVPHRRSWCRR